MTKFKGHLKWILWYILDIEFFLLSKAKFLPIFPTAVYFDKGQTISKLNYGVLNSSTKRKKLTILSGEDVQDSKFRSSFGRIEETLICFRDLKFGYSEKATKFEKIFHLKFDATQ